MHNSGEQTFSGRRQQALLQQAEIVSHQNVSLARAGSSSGELSPEAVRRAPAV